MGIACTPTDWCFTNGECDGMGSCVPQTNLPRCSSGCTCENGNNNKNSIRKTLKKKPPSQKFYALLNNSKQNLDKKTATQFCDCPSLLNAAIQSSGISGVISGAVGGVIGGVAVIVIIIVVVIFVLRRRRRAMPQDVNEQGNVPFGLF